MNPWHQGPTWLVCRYLQEDLNRCFDGRSLEDSEPWSLYHVYYDYVCLHTVLQVATILLVENCIGHNRLHEHVSLDVYTQYVLKKNTIKQDPTDISKHVFFFNFDVHLRRSWKGNVQLCWHPTLQIWILGTDDKKWAFFKRATWGEVPSYPQKKLLWVALMIRCGMNLYVSFLDMQRT